MCWTESRKQKVEYFQSIGMWYLPEESEMCNSLLSLQEVIDKSKQGSGGVKKGEDHDVAKKVLDKCCTGGDYWKKRRIFDSKQEKVNDKKKKEVQKEEAKGDDAIEEK